MRLAPRLAEARHSDKEKTYCGFIARLTPHLSEWILISLGIIRLLISGSQVRALVRPPTNQRLSSQTFAFAFPFERWGHMLGHKNFSAC
jgi:hypothetical protein